MGHEKRKPIKSCFYKKFICATEVKKIKPDPTQWAKNAVVAFNPMKRRKEVVGLPGLRDSTEIGR